MNKIIEEGSNKNEDEGDYKIYSYEDIIMKPITN